MRAGIVTAKPECEFHDLIVVGGGAAGFFLAINAANQAAGMKVCILESDAQVLRKVRISGGGRCNVTNVCEEADTLASHYPRGGKLLKKIFQSFGTREMKDWLASHDVVLKAEADGRMFPVTDSSQTIIDCFVHSAEQLGVMVHTQTQVTSIAQQTEKWAVEAPGKRYQCRYLALTTGGNPGHFNLVKFLDHTVTPLVPSLFTFRSASPWIEGLAGVSVPRVRLVLPGTGISSEGPLLITHQGISGPAVLRLSAWAAREFAELGYQAEIHADVTLAYPAKQWVAENRSAQGRKLISNTPFPGIPSRLWERLLSLVPGTSQVRWADVTAVYAQKLIQTLEHIPIPIHGKNTFKDEFVTCGGVSLSEVRHHTMESRLHNNLYFAGEVLDIDAVTGGYNFQAAWTTAWHAASAIASCYRSHQRNRNDQGEAIQV